MIAPDKRDARRVAFDRPFPANMMAIDGTWRRACTVRDVSDSGAKLIVVQGLPLQEFFLVLSSVGLAYRRCELAWVNGEELGVTVIKSGRAQRLSLGNTAASASKWTIGPVVVL